MTNKTYLLLANCAVEFIKVIPRHKYELIEFLKISNSTYEKFKPFFEWKYGETIEYRKDDKTWYYRGVISQSP